VIKARDEEKVSLSEVADGCMINKSRVTWIVSMDCLSQSESVTPNVTSRECTEGRRTYLEYDGKARESPGNTHTLVAHHSHSRHTTNN
jgi:hypothetical protein